MIAEKETLGFQGANRVKSQNRWPQKLPKSNSALRAEVETIGPAAAKPPSKPTERSSSLLMTLPPKSGSSLEALASVSISMGATDAPEPPAQTVPMSAASARAKTTALSFARPKPTWPVVTPLRPDHWRSVFSNFGILDEFLDVVEGLESGFTLNSSISITTTHIYNNHKSAIDHANIFEEMIESELAAGCLIGLFEKEELESLIGPFLAHPLGVVPKSGNRWWVIKDLSYPRDGTVPSLNSLTDISDVPVNWGGFKEMVELVVTAPPGSQGAMFDWENAFRVCPVKCSKLWMGVIAWRKGGSTLVPRKFWVDSSTKFGNARSTGIFNRPNKAFVIICMRKGYGIIIFWVDDLTICRVPINFSPPWRYSFDLNNICKVARYLSIPFSAEKLRPFSSLTRYLGFVWCWDSKIVELPEEKRLEVREKVIAAANTAKVSLKLLHSITGSLSHVSMVVPEGHANLCGLWNLLSAMSSSNANPHFQHSWSSSSHRDLDWWTRYLATPNIAMRLCTEVVPDNSFHVYSDASTSWGIGVVIGKEFDRFQLQEGWQNWEGEAKDIGWADRHILIHVDNQGVVGSWNARVSRNPSQNTVLGRILRMLLRAQCFISMVYVASGNNPADAPSRGLNPEGLTRANFPGFPTALKNVLLRK